MMSAIFKAAEERKDEKALRLTEVYQNSAKFRYLYVEFCSELQKLSLEKNSSVGK